jgi:DNA mismatch repair protein MutS2
MDAKTLTTLEYPKILERLAARCAFSASKDLARTVRPTADVQIARQRQAETTEARRLLEARPSTTIGGARDIRAHAQAASRGIVLDPPALLEVKNTLIAARELKRAFEHLDTTHPFLTELAARIPIPPGLVDAISQVLNDRGEIYDHASPKLAAIRRDLRIVHDRLLAKLQKMLGDPKIAPYLQDSLITSRDGRYVIPLRADFKGRIKAVVHDQSASGATLFVEPLSVVEHNNQYRQLQLDERDEIRRILAELSAKIGGNAEPLGWMIESIAEMDLIFARAKYAEDVDGHEPQLRDFPAKPRGKTPPAGTAAPAGGIHPGVTVRLMGARHPLLDLATVVPIDVLLDENTYSIIITGPNTGGKTVSLKTVGLLALMAQSGMHIPAEAGSEITCFHNIYADIGDEQSIEQSLSTFSGHITNIIRILDKADARSLVIFDELGSGTDPQEGAALAMAILSHLLDRGITTLVATHYPELKAYALARAGVVNASVEFDVETLRPTYHLIIGLPGASNALTIARRLGLPGGIIEAARAGISTEELQAGDLLQEIHQQRDLIRRTRQEVEAARSEAHKLREALHARLEAIEDERRHVLERARQEAEARLEALDAELRELRRKLAAARQPLEVIEEVAARTAELEDETAVPVERRPETGDGRQDAVVSRPSPVLLPIRLGDRVRLKSLGSQGVVSVLSEDEAEVQLGVMRIRTRLHELERVGGGEAAAAASQPAPARASGGAAAAPGMELDLRGLRADEALRRLDDYLDAGYLAHMPFVRIIHGKGTGKLREAVHKALKGNAHVQSYELGGEGEGGDGVTVVKFR